MDYRFEIGTVVEGHQTGNLYRFVGPIHPDFPCHQFEVLETNCEDFDVGDVVRIEEWERSYSMVPN